MIIYEILLYSAWLNFFLITGRNVQGKTPTKPFSVTVNTQLPWFIPSRHGSLSSAIDSLEIAMV